MQHSHNTPEGKGKKDSMEPGTDEVFLKKDIQYSEKEKVLSNIPMESMKHYGIIPLSFDGNVLVVGALDPDSIEVRDALNFFTAPLEITYVLEKITQEDFSRKINLHNKLETKDSIEQVLEKIDLDRFEDISITGLEKETSSVDMEEAPIIRIVSSMIKNGVVKGASDIHIDPSTTNSAIRFRIDGMLEKEYDIPKRIHSAIVTRLKILSKLRLDERRKPQDGRFSSQLDGSRIDFRVAIFPTTNGEKIIIRILSQKTDEKSISELGLTSLNEKKARNAVSFSGGLILATGPTGSGKTISIYSFLGLLDKEHKNIISLEDPVEVTVDSISQSQIFPEIGYTFSSGLRSVLRGDPDVIFVGEIRDRETAQLAIQASLTGHLVFSTLHTNTAIGAIARLIDLGVEPFFIAPTLRLVVGQRLVRKIHDKTGVPVPISPSIKKKYEEQFSTLPTHIQDTLPSFETVYTPTPNPKTPDGLKGRIGAFEFLSVNEEISEAILAGASEQDIFNIARSDGYITFQEDAFLKAVGGIIPLTEVARISGEDVDPQDSLT